MNFALSALVISLLLLPGAFVLTAYYTSFREKKTNLHISFSELLFRGLAFSFFIHGLSVWVLNLYGTSVDFKLLYDVIAGKDLPTSSNDLSHSFLQFTFYTIFLASLFFSITKVFKWIVVKYNYDIYWHSLRTSNYWFLIFSGRYLESRIKGSMTVTDILFLDILAPGNIVYSGYLFDFNYSPHKDVLENIILKNAVKRTYVKSADGNHELTLTQPKTIPGDALVIPTKDIININIYYVNLGGTEFQDETTEA